MVQMNSDRRTRLNANKWVEEATTRLSLQVMSYELVLQVTPREMALRSTSGMKCQENRETVPNQILNFQSSADTPKVYILSRSTVSVQSVVLRRPWHFRYFVKLTKAAIKTRNPSHNSCTR